MQTLTFFRFFCIVKILLFCKNFMKTNLIFKIIRIIVFVIPILAQNASSLDLRQDEITFYQNPDTQFNYAVHLMGKSRFYDAITEFKRFLYFHPNDSRYWQAEYNIAVCYRQGGHWKTAISILEETIENGQPSALVNQAQMMLGRTLIRNHQANLSRLEFDDLINFSDLKSEAMYWKGWSYIYQFNWQAAAKVFARLAKLAPNKYLNAANDLFTFCDQEKSATRKSPGKAKMLSRFLPGVGQMYAGRIKNGLIASALNGTFAYYTINALLAKRFLDAAIIYYLFWYRYYGGNVNNAKNFAYEFNQRQNETALQQLQAQYGKP